MNLTNTNSSVSVIITCFNQAEYIRKTLQSVIEQTMPALEIIIIDDGSTDATALALEEVSKNTHTIPLIIHQQKNTGIAGARNAGARMAHGEWLVFLDGDDMLFPTFIQKTKTFAAKHNEAGFVYTNAELFGTVKGVFQAEPYNPKRLLLKNFILATSLMKRSVFDAVGGYKSELNAVGYEDWDFYLTAFERGRTGVFLPETLVRYRQNEFSRNKAAGQNANAVKAIRKLHPKLFTPRYYLTYSYQVIQALLRKFFFRS